jgi:hypothetical protein
VSCGGGGGGASSASAALLAEATRIAVMRERRYEIKIPP